MIYGTLTWISCSPDAMALENIVNVYYNIIKVIDKVDKTGILRNI